MKSKLKMQPQPKDQDKYSEKAQDKQQQKVRDLKYKVLSFVKGVEGRINSVMRLSDSKVFTLNDEVNIIGEAVLGWDRRPYHNIYSFSIGDNGELEVCCKSDIPVCGTQIEEIYFKSGVFLIDEIQSTGVYPSQEKDVNDLYNRELLNSAVVEIEHLRESNRFMNARLTMFDTVVSLVKTDIYGKHQGDCCGNDIVQQIKYHTGKK